MTLKQKVVIKHAFKFNSKLFDSGEYFITCSSHEQRHDKKLQ
jgi:hypothetical protein